MSDTQNAAVSKQIALGAIFGAYPNMNSHDKIPNSWIDDGPTDVGWFPLLRVTPRGKPELFGTSFSVPTAGILLLILGIALVYFNPLGILFAFGAPLIVGSIVAIWGLPLIRRTIFANVIFKDDKTLVIVDRQGQTDVLRENVLGYQLLVGPGNSAQLNLLYTTTPHQIARKKLYSHSIGRYVFQMVPKLLARDSFVVRDYDGKVLG